MIGPDSEECRSQIPFFEMIFEKTKSGRSNVFFSGFQFAMVELTVEELALLICLLEHYLYETGQIRIRTVHGAMISIVRTCDGLLLRVQDGLNQNVVQPMEHCLASALIIVMRAELEAFHAT